MPISTSRAIGGGVAALAVVAVARRARALAPSGAVAAWIAGASTVAGGGWAAGGALVAFFASSSILSRANRRRALTSVQKRGNERDAVQVVANGGVATMAALGMASAAAGDDARSVFYGSLATASADTWATETGRWSARQPRRLLVGRVTPPGTSGGMTPVGTAGRIAGAAMIALVGALDPIAPVAERRRRFFATPAAGFAGALADSVLGASVQEVRVCPICGQETELPAHCGTVTVHARGWRGFDNDAVNALATALGGLAGLAFGRFARARCAAGVARNDPGAC